MAERFHFNPYVPFAVDEMGPFWQLGTTRRVDLDPDASTVAELATEGRGVTVAELRAELSADAVVDLMRSRVVVERRLDVEGRDSRTDGFFALQGRAHARRRLEAARVLVLGTGAIGSHVAWMLTALGVGALTVVDCDVVEVSNLNRQLLYTLPDVGLPKVEVLAARLRELGGGTRVESVDLHVSSVDDVRRLLARGRSTLVVKAMDTPAELSHWVDEACVAAGVAYVQGGFIGTVGLVGPTYRPGAPCHACYAGSDASVRRLAGTGPTVPHLTEIVAGKMVAEATRVLLGEAPLLEARRETYDELTGAATVDDLPTTGPCVRCGRPAPPRRGGPSSPPLWPSALFCALAALLPLIGTVPGWRLSYTVTAVLVSPLLLMAGLTPPQVFRRAFVGGLTYFAASLALTLRLRPATLGVPRYVHGVVDAAHLALAVLVMAALAVTVYTWSAAATFVVTRGVVRLGVRVATWCRTRLARRRRRAGEDDGGRVGDQGEAPVGSAGAAAARERAGVAS